MTTPESIERINQCKRELGEDCFFVKNPELEEGGETLNVILDEDPQPPPRNRHGHH